VRVVLHGLPNDVGDFVVTPVVHFPHSVEYPPLYGLQPINNAGYGAFQNYVGSIVQEIILVHPLEGDDVFLAVLFSCLTHILAGLCLYVFSSKVQKYHQENKQKIYFKSGLKQVGFLPPRKRLYNLKRRAANPICKAFFNTGWLYYA
jgi:hypothetical protein